jgi:hypothetical protein
VVFIWVSGVGLFSELTEAYARASLLSTHLRWLTDAHSYRSIKAMKKALLFYSQVTHRAGPDVPRIVGTAPKSGLVPALISTALFMALIVYLFLEAMNR